MAVLTLFVLFYLVAAIWIIFDSRWNRGREPALHRFGAIVWGSTGAELLALLIVLWWFLKSVLGTFLSPVVDTSSFTPTARETDRARAWIIFPQRLLARGFTGRGEFRWTPGKS